MIVPDPAGVTHAPSPRRYVELLGEPVALIPEIDSPVMFATTAAGSVDDMLGTPLFDVTRIPLFAVARPETVVPLAP